MNPGNTQPVLSHEADPKGTLDVHSCFYTIQGEGPFAGRAAVFLRLFGCNIRCKGCDTEYSSKRQRLAPEEVVKLVMSKGPSWFPSLSNDLVVITGGEPFRQNITPTVELLLNCGLHVQVETNGIVGPMEEDYDKWETWLDDGGADLHSGDVDIVVSPKAHSVSDFYSPRMWAGNVWWKYVMSAGKVEEADGLPSDVLGMGRRPARPPLNVPSGKIFVTPFDCNDVIRNSENAKAAADSAMAFGYRFGVQLHKVVGLD